MILTPGCGERVGRFPSRDGVDGRESRLDSTVFGLGEKSIMIYQKGYRPNCLVIIHKNMNEITNKSGGPMIELDFSIGGVLRCVFFFLFNNLIICFKVQTLPKQQEVMASRCEDKYTQMNS